MYKVERYLPTTYGREKCLIIDKSDVSKTSSIKSTRGVYYLDNKNVNTHTNEARNNATQKDQEEPGSGG